MDRITDERQTKEEKGIHELEERAEERKRLRKKGRGKLIQLSQVVDDKMPYATALLICKLHQAPLCGWVLAVVVIIIIIIIIIGEQAK